MSTYKELYKFYVENVPLTVGYYKEYIGFSQINGDIPDLSQSAILKFEDYALVLEKSENLNLHNEELVLQLGLNSVQMKSLYNEYKLKTRIHKVYFNTNDEVKEFSIKDCNGNILHFKSRFLDN